MTGELIHVPWLNKEQVLDEARNCLEAFHSGDYTTYEKLADMYAVEFAQRICDLESEAKT